MPHDAATPSNPGNDVERGSQRETHTVEVLRMFGARVERELKLLQTLRDSMRTGG